MRMVSKILVIEIFLTLILSSCLPLNYYPSKISEPNEQYVGFAVGANAWYTNPYDGRFLPMPSLLLYHRKNLTNHFDIGFELGLPYFAINSRLGMFYKNDHHLLVLDGGIGMNILQGPVTRLSTTLFIPPLYVLIGINNTYYLPLAGGVAEQTSINLNSIYTKIGFEDKQMSKFIPFVYMAYTADTDNLNPIFNYKLLFSKYDNEFDYTIRRLIAIGIGWDFNFNF